MKAGDLIPYIIYKATKTQKGIVRKNQEFYSRGAFYCGSIALDKGQRIDPNTEVECVICEESVELAIRTAKKNIEKQNEYIQHLLDAVKNQRAIDE